MIDICNIRKSYTSVVALDDVSISIPSNTILALIGPNGAGKTTLLRILSRITSMDSGQILIDGNDYLKYSNKVIGYLPEERGLYRDMKIGEQAIFFASMKGLKPREAEDRLKHLLSKFELLKIWDKKAYDLSKGTQQLIQFIITIVHEPKILILDEPFSGLDPINRVIVENIILSLKNKCSAIFISTHDMHSVFEYCDHVMLINKGRNILSGNIKDIISKSTNMLYEFKIKGEANDFLSQLPPNASLLETDFKDDISMIKVKFSNEEDIDIFIKNIFNTTTVSSFNEIVPTIKDLFFETLKNANL